MTPLSFDIRIAAAERLLVDIREFQVPRNRITFLFGESGIGKSLIARSIYGLLDPEEFTIAINGDTYDSYLKRPETREIRGNGFFVFQEPSSHLNPLLPLGKQLREGTLSQAPNEWDILSDLWKLRSSRVDPTEIGKLLEVYPKPHRPSGGEKQRMFLAMALMKIDLILQAGKAHHNTLFVFDEPTGSLDNHYRDVFLSLLFKRFQHHQFTILLITHDYSMISVVTGSHKAFLDKVSFRELRRSHERLEMKEFKAETYIGWLKKRSMGNQARRPPTSAPPLLRLESEAVAFGRQLNISRDPAGREACPLEVFPGTIVYLKAPSGEGKTTLMKMMMGLIQGERLRLTVGSTVLTEQTPGSFWREHIWGKRMTMVFQHADEALNPRSKVKEIFHGLPTQKRTTIEEIKRQLKELFDEEMSDEFLNKPVTALSGGQKQRLNLLRGLDLETEILFLDEPLSGLDFDSTTRVLTLLEEKRRAGRGILIVSHNEEIISTIIHDEDIYYLHSRRAAVV